MIVGHRLSFAKTNQTSSNGAVTSTNEFVEVALNLNIKPKISKKMILQ